jgi:hypothetical protein
MTRTHLNLAAYAMACVMSLLAPTARAQDAAAVVGTYCLRGVMEVGSCIRLSEGGGFEYFLAYGAYDENSEGTWRLESGGIIVDSPPYDKKPAFAFKRLQRGDTDAYDVIVESKAGRSIQGIDVSVTCDGRTARAGVTQAEGYKVDCTNPPTEISLGLAMFGVAPQAIGVADKAGADKVYVFEFDAGDMGRKKFVAHRLTIKSSSVLEMTYADTPIQELEGRRFAYVRSR